MTKGQLKYTSIFKLERSMIKYIYLVTKKQKLPTPTKIAGSFKGRNKNDFKNERKKEGGKGRKKNKSNSE